MNVWDPAGLDALAALADAGSFERAARQLAVTQSAVSQRLRALETQLGRLLVVRSRPLQLTESGKLLLRYARQMHALRANLAVELGQSGVQEKLPIAVNADSLATWVLPALDDVLQAGLKEGWGLELVVDDQDFTHDWLRDGAVLGCVSTVAEPLKGCQVHQLGAMRYVAVASPGFVARELGGSLHAGNFAQAPWLVFNRKDDMAASWLALAFGLQGVRLDTRAVPSTEAHARAATLGWGIGVMPEPMAEPLLQSGQLMALRPQIHVDVALYWHQWKLVLTQAPAVSPPAGKAVATLIATTGGTLDRIGAALALGASRALRPMA
ncbi:MAG: hypothetical protein RIQ60_1432 [Pseudomonadota bacterium]|jgi:LysR family transcriptional regulator (chromosome initiation inhibitor)